MDANDFPGEDCAPHDRNSEIARADLDHFDCTGTPTENMLTWPAHLGAPVEDGDPSGNP